MKFYTVRTVDLSDIWLGCSLKLQALTYKEAKDLSTEYSKVDPNDTTAQDKMFEFVQSKFVSGTARNEKDEIVEFTAADLPDMPIEVFSKCITSLTGATSPN